jgi:hypothetical protein
MSFEILLGQQPKTATGGEAPRFKECAGNAEEKSCKMKEPSPRTTRCAAEEDCAQNNVNMTEHEMGCMHEGRYTPPWMDQLRIDRRPRIAGKSRAHEEPSTTFSII